MPHSKDRARLRLGFEGTFQCRLATDPDPTREPRGISGYTFALAGESDLDGIIRLQADEIPDRDYRQSQPPFPGGKDAFGVFVTSAAIVGGKAKPPASSQKAVQQLLGANVRLLDRPRYVLRNQIVADGVYRIAPPIVPFNIQVESSDGAILLRRADPLDLNDPHKPIWRIPPGDPDIERRLPIYNRPSDEVMATIGIEGSQAIRDYFQMRREWLQLEIAKATCPVTRSNLQTRLFAIETHSNPPESDSPGLIENRLWLQTLWNFAVRGPCPEVKGDHLLGGHIPTGEDPEDYWHTRFWHGGWDGDVMRGAMRGSLELPFIANSE